MLKTIQFSAEEINELRSFYSNELATAEERIKHIRAILAKIGNASNGREKKSGTTNSEPVAMSVPSPVKKKRGRPATKKITAEVVNAAPKKRGRPAKTESSDAPASAVGGKKRGRKPKLQIAQSKSEMLVSAGSNASAQKGKKRGRKPLAANKVSNDASIGLGKAQSAPAKTGAKRGRKPGKKIENLAANSAENVKAVATKKSEKSSKKATASGAKRGRKPSVVGKKSTDTAAAEAKTTAPETKAAANKKVPKSNSAKADVKKAAASKTKTPKEAKSDVKKAATSTTKAPKEAKSDVKKPATPKVSKAKPAGKGVKAKVVNAAPAKVVSAKKTVAKDSKKVAPAQTAKAPAKVEVAPKKVSKKELYQELIFKTFASEPRFYTTEEILNAGIKEFNLKGKEKDAAKNTMQFILNGLQSQSKILRRRKEKDRQAYWASLGTNDEGYIK